MSNPANKLPEPDHSDLEAVKLNAEIEKLRAETIEIRKRKSSIFWSSVIGMLPSGITLIATGIAAWLSYPFIRQAIEADSKLLEAKKATLVLEIKEFESEKDRLTNQIGNFEGQVFRLHNERTALTNLIEVMKSELEKFADGISRQNLEISERNRTISNLTFKTEEILKQRSASENALANQISDLTTQRLELVRGVQIFQRQLSVHLDNMDWLTMAARVYRYSSASTPMPGFDRKVQRDLVELLPDMGRALDRQLTNASTNLQVWRRISQETNLTELFSHLVNSNLQNLRYTPSALYEQIVTNSQLFPRPPVNR